jgi:hypothetical protein
LNRLSTATEVITARIPPVLEMVIDTPSTKLEDLTCPCPKTDPIACKHFAVPAQGKVIQLTYFKARSTTVRLRPFRSPVVPT